MPKTIKNCFFKNLTFMKLLEAHERAKKNKMGKREVLEFEVDLETNITNILNSILNGTYRIGKYREFKIYEPKERVIKSLPYRDRVVHQWYVEEFIKPYIMPRFIYDTYGCITGKGTHKAVHRMQYFMRKKYQENPNYYIVKCDIAGFFYNIDKEILTKIMRHYITDKKLFEFTQLMIGDGTDSPVGLAIGNYSSQYFANIYLNEVDRYMKFELREKYYVRYMDDFIILVDTKEDAKEMLRKVNNFVVEKLHLSLNHKCNYYPRTVGTDFCGFRIYESHMKVRRRSIQKIRKNIKRWNQNPRCGKEILLTYNSWLGHVQHSSSFRLQQQVNLLMNDRVRKIIGIGENNIKIPKEKAPVEIE